MIVVVDDCDTAAEAYRANFSREGVSVYGFSSCDFLGWVSAAADADIEAIEAVLIRESAAASGLACTIKRRSAAAIIAMNHDKSLASTLDLFAEGVDDVVMEPCHVREILARIEAISRRARIIEADATTIVDIKTFGDGRDPLIGGVPMELPRRELRILEVLAGKRPRRVTRAQIFSTVYGVFDDAIDESAVEGHISKLRRRLKARLGYDPIESQRHLGYRLVERAMARPGAPAGS